MTDQNLPTRLAQALALRNISSTGAQDEYARLAPLHGALLKVVTVLENYPDLAFAKIARDEALSSLEEELEKMERKL